MLGIETSCDETAAGIVGDGGRLLSNVVASQVELHARYGGVVPEVASRQHVLQIGPVVRQAMAEAGASWQDLGGIAVTYGPGLAGALVIGVNAAKGIAAAQGLPLVGVNHMAGHVYGAWVRKAGGAGPEDPGADPGFPLLCLIVSGGHTELAVMREHGQFELVGETRDDAAGEAFDKAARVLGLGYPGGPEIQRASEGAAATERFPRAWLPGTSEFSFSGLKTALIRRAREVGIYPPAGDAVPGAAPGPVVRALARGFQDAVVDVLVGKTVAAAERHDCRGIVVAGGVAANRLLRERLLARSTVPVRVPHPALCTDNGAMVAMCGWYLLDAGLRSGNDLDIDPGLRLGAAAPGRGAAAG